MPLPTCLDFSTGVGTVRFILSEETFKRLKEDAHFQLPDVVIELLERLRKINTSVRFPYLCISQRTLHDEVSPVYTLRVENPRDKQMKLLEASPRVNLWAVRPSGLAELVMRDLGAQLRNAIKSRKDSLGSPPYPGDLEPKWLADLAIAFGALTAIPAGAGTNY